MRVMKKLATLALGFTLVGGTTAYADTAVVDQNFFTNEQGAEDRFIVRCGAPTDLCAFVDDVGPFNDNVFYVHLKCKSPKQSGTERSTAPAGGSTDEVCVSNCSKAQLEFGCAIDSPFCDDNYHGEITCYGESIDVQQTQDH